MTVAALLHPGLLALGAALTAIPILIHLLNRQRVQRRPWAAMLWLQAALKRHQRRLRIESWLILLLRIAALLLLGLALARPVFRDAGIADFFGGKRSVYVVVDTSYSMAATRAGRTVMELAKAETDALLQTLGDEDALAVVATNDPRGGQSDGRTPFVLVSRAVGKEAATRAKEAVGRLEVRHSPARWSETLALLRRQMVDDEANRQVVLVTDLQEKDWDDEVGRRLEALLRLPARVRIVNVGGEPRRNLTVAHVTIPMDRDAFAGRPLRIAATIENQGPTPVEGARVSVMLDADPTPLRTLRAPVLPAFDAATKRPGREVVVFELSGRDLEEAGAHVLEVSVTPPPTDPEADDLALDSRRRHAFRVREKIRVAAWTRGSRRASPSAETFLRGLFSGPGLYDLRSVLNEAAFLEILRARRVDLVVLANVAPRRETAEALRAFVAGGGALLAFVGDAATLRDPAALNDPFWERPDRRLLPRPFGDPQRVDRTRREAPFLLDLEADEDGVHPLARPFVGPDAAEWIGLMPPKIWGRFPFQDGEEGQVVLRYADEASTPFAIEGAYGAGRTLWVSTSLDEGWLGQGVPFFLPVFLDGAAVHLTRPDEARLNLDVGRRLVAGWLPTDATEVRVLGPGGRRLTPTRYEGENALERPTWVQDRIGTAGTWVLSYRSQGEDGRTRRVEEPFAVNLEPDEGRLLAADPERLKRRFPAEADLEVLTTWGDDVEVESRASEGELTRWVLWIAFGLLVVESLLAWAFGRRSTTGGAA